VILKSLARGVAAVAIVGAAAAGVTSIASGVPVASAPAVQPVVFGVPLPLDPAADVPSTDQLASVLYGLADPNVPFRSKSGLVEGGIGLIEAKTADRLLASLSSQGALSFQVSDIAPAGPGAATATVTASGPQTSPTTQNVTFVDQGGWKVSRASASSVLSALA